MMMANKEDLDALNEAFKLSSIGISEIPELISLLYDFDLMPEQIVSDQAKLKLILIANHFKAFNVRMKSAISQSWQDISTAPMDGTQLLLAAYIIPSPEAARNGSKPFWDIGLGRPIYPERNGTHWTSILGGEPTHWKSIEPPTSPEKQ